MTSRRARLALRVLCLTAIVLAVLAADVDPYGYEQALETCYARPETLAAHLADLDRFAEFSRSRDVPLLVVAFPHLLNAAATRRQIGPVIRHLEQRGVPVLDVFPLLETLPVPERVVNRNDAHPSVRLNRLVADALLAALESHGLLARARAR